MKTKLITPNVLLLSFPNRKELTFTMCRVEEYYEAASDNLRGKNFTWPEFIDEFTNEKGHLDYFHSWSGFNIPGESFRAWVDGCTDMSLRERDMVAEVYQHVAFDQKFYVIAAQESDVSVEDHEIAHATYYTTDEYRAIMQDLNAKLDNDTRVLLINGFADLGYSETVFEDELQAFLSTSTFEYLNKRFEMSQEMFDRVTPAYMKVFKDFCKSS